MWQAVAAAGGDVRYTEFTLSVTYRFAVTCAADRLVDYGWAREDCVSSGRVPRGDVVRERECTELG